MLVNIEPSNNIKDRLKKEETEFFFSPEVSLKMPRKSLSMVLWELGCVLSCRGSINLCHTGAYLIRENKTPKSKPG